VKSAEQRRRGRDALLSSPAFRPRTPHGVSDARGRRMPPPQQRRKATRRRQ
jgi:hypothetical protein